MEERVSPALMRWRRLHSILFAALCGIGAVVGALLPDPQIELQLLILAVGLVLLGLPHGAADWTLGRAWLAPRLGRSWAPAFAVGYLLVTAAVVGAWVVSPPVSLVLFLAVSAWHFGHGDVGPAPRARGQGVGATIARGMLPMVLPFAFHPEPVVTCFQWLAPEVPTAWASEAVVGPVRIGALALASALVARSVWRFRESGRAGPLEALEIAGLVVAAAFLPPLVFFALYFCAGHAVRHVLELIDRLGPDEPGEALRRLARDVAPVTLATLLLASFGFAGLGGSEVTASAVRVIFVGLAALTAPHMILTARLRSLRLAPGLDGGLSSRSCAPD